MRVAVSATGSEREDARGDIPSWAPGVVVVVAAAAAAVVVVVGGGGGGDDRGGGGRQPRRPARAWRCAFSPSGPGRPRGGFICSSGASVCTRVGSRATDGAQGHNLLYNHRLELSSERPRVPAPLAWRAAAETIDCPQCVLAVWSDAPTILPSVQWLGRRMARVTIGTHPVSELAVDHRVRDSQESIDQANTRVWASRARIVRTVESELSAQPVVGSEMRTLRAHCRLIRRIYGPMMTPSSKAKGERCAIYKPTRGYLTCGSCLVHRDNRPLAFSGAYALMHTPWTPPLLEQVHTPLQTASSPEKRGSWCCYHLVSDTRCSQFTTPLLRPQGLMRAHLFLCVFSQSSGTWTRTSRPTKGQLPCRFSACHLRLCCALCFLE